MSTRREFIRNSAVATAVQPRMTATAAAVPHSQPWSQRTVK